MSHMYECMLTAAEIQHFALAIDKRTLKKHIFAMNGQAQLIRMGMAYTDHASEENK